MSRSYKQVGPAGLTPGDLNRMNRQKFGDGTPEERRMEDAHDPRKDPRDHDFIRDPNRREAVCKVCGRGQSAHEKSRDFDEDLKEDSFEGLVEKLEHEGKSHEYATKIAAKVNREKYPPNGKH